MRLSLPLVLLLASGLANGQASTRNDCDRPKEIVDLVWRLATQGDLLTAEGWDKMARGAFAYPPPAVGGKVAPIRPQGGKTIRVVSNDWGIVGCTMEPDTARVVVEYYDAGSIDETLQYRPGKEPPPMGKSEMMFTLAFVAGHWETYKSKGDAMEVAEVKTTPPAWRIESPQGPAWATVNAAIRYLLEMREGTRDPETKKNADETLSRLLHFHSR